MPFTIIDSIVHYGCSLVLFYQGQVIAVLLINQVDSVTGSGVFINVFRLLWKRFKFNQSILAAISTTPMTMGVNIDMMASKSLLCCITNYSDNY
jgi:hypothetical protein